MIPFVFALPPLALADDAFAVAPFEDGVVVTTVWHEHLELWVVGPEGVRAHEVWPDAARVTNPTVACGRRVCGLAWTTFREETPVGAAALLDPREPGPLAPVDLGEATRVRASARHKDWLLVVETMTDPPAVARSATFRTMDRRGRLGPVIPVDGGPVRPYTLVFDGDGVQYLGAGAVPAALREVPGMPAVPAKPPGEPAYAEVCADGSRVGEGGCGPQGTSSAVVFGPGGTLAWVTPEGRVRAGLVEGWAVDLERLTPERTTWVAKTMLFPFFEAGNDGRSPFRVPIRVGQVLGVELTLRFEGPFTGVATGSAPIADRAQLGAGGEPALGEVWLTAQGRPGALYRSMEALLDADGLAGEGPCGRPRRVRLADDGIRLEFDRWPSTLQAEPIPLYGERGETTLTGTWLSTCAAEGSQTVTVSWSVGAVLLEIREEERHRGISFGL